MKNKKILVWALITAITATSIWVSFADETTTTTTWVVNKKFERQELTAEQKTQMEAIKAILDKKADWETLTSTEQTLLDEFEASKPEMWSWQLMWNRPEMWSGQLLKWKLETTTNTQKVSTKYKTAIDKKIDTLVVALDSYDSDKKIEKLEAFVSKIEAAQTKIKNSTSYSDTKKSTYNSIFDYIIEKTRTEIDLLDTEEDDDILSEIFD